MSFERTLKLRTEEPIQRNPCSIDLPHFEPGLAAALRRAFAPPPTANSDEFDHLLAKLG